MSGFGRRRARESHQQSQHTREHRPTWQAAVREGLEHLPHPWHNPHEAERQSRPWRGALQRTDRAAVGRGGQWAQAPVIQAAGLAPSTGGGSGKRCQRRREGVVGSADRDAGEGRSDDTLLLRRVAPESGPPDARCDALLGLFLWPAQVTPAAPCFLAHCHAPAVLQPPLPQLPGRSHPRPVLFLLRLGPRGGVHGQGAKSHLPVQASPSGPSEESSPPSSRPPQLSVPQLSPAPLLRSFNANFPSPDNSLSVLRHQAGDLSQLPGSLPFPEPHHLKGRRVLTVLNPEQFANLYAFSPAPGSPPRSQLHLPLLIHPSCHHEIIY